MEPITFPDFMNEENMRKMSRQELVNLYLMVGQAMMPAGATKRMSSRTVLKTALFAFRVPPLVNSS